MKEIIITVISSLLGGALGAFWNYKGKVVDSSASREDIYADHTEELFKRLDNLTNERDDLKQQNINLMNQVDQLKSQTKLLEKQVQVLTKRVKDLTKAIEGK
ncbi:hypothetical protein CP356_06710 [Lactobacillus sp. UMNPBX5]|nr:hypothetical protein CP356_06710 [Lactobacillus sp. UMNPBX5]